MNILKFVEDTVNEAKERFGDEIKEEAFGFLLNKFKTFLGSMKDEEFWKWMEALELRLVEIETKEILGLSNVLELLGNILLRSIAVVSFYEGVKRNGIIGDYYFIFNKDVPGIYVKTTPVEVH